MSWSPIINLIGPTGPQGTIIKNGKYTVGDPTTITFDTPFADSNYIVILTPFTSPTGPSGIPVAYIIAENSGTASFELNTSGVDGVYWVATPYIPGPSGPTGPTQDFDSGGGLGVASDHNGNWVAVGFNLGFNYNYTGPSILHSSDGLNWTGTTGINFNSGQGFGVASDRSGTWVAVGFNTDAQGLQAGPSIIRSTDGVTWTETTGANFDVGGAVGGVATDGNGTWIAVGNYYDNVTNEYVGPSIIRSTDSIHWTGTTGANFDSGGGIGVATDGNGHWVAAGLSFTPEVTNTGPTILYSADNGLSWTGTTGANFDSEICHGVATDGSGHWVAVGENRNNDTSVATGPSILYSEDGIHWTGTTGANFDSGGGLEVATDGNGKWVAVGYSLINESTYTGPTILYSEDGIHWTGTTGANFNTGLCAGVTHDGNGHWVAVGTTFTPEVTSTGPSIINSNDGITWF